MQWNDPFLARVYFIRGSEWAGIEQYDEACSTHLRWEAVTTMYLGRWLTGSSHCHVAVGNSTHVMDPAFQGDRLWNRRTFECRYPTLDFAVDIPASPVTLTTSPSTRSGFAMLARWLSGSRLPVNDCVTAVVSVLRRGGVAVPPAVTSPRQLLVHLLSHPGASIVEVQRSSARPAGQDAGDS